VYGGGASVGDVDAEDWRFCVILTICGNLESVFLFVWVVFAVQSF
jgi:hypothetical protein